MGDFRADELASAAGITVALLRSYQSKGLLPPPRHVGRTALYGDRHLDRLRQIEALKRRGHSLRAIAERFGAPTVIRPSIDQGERLRLRDVANRSGVPIEMLRSFEASGLVTPRLDEDGAHYSEADVRAVECVLLLVGSGIPLEGFLEVAQPQLRAAAEVATGSLDLFDRYVASRLPDDAPSARHESLIAMAAAIGDLAGYLVERQVLAADAHHARSASRGGGG